MARKSRKETLFKLSEKQRIEQLAKRYQTGLYVRLSRETIATMERDTIGTQLTLLKEFAATIPELEVREIYVDDDITGTNFDRPGYERMMEDVESERINCIVVKDLSRFAREHLGAGEYLERIFPEKGVRFIAITDNVDTLVDDGGIIVPFKNVLNERYAKDTSVKVTNAFKTMQTEGKFCGWKPIYGYVRSTKDRYTFEIDEEAAGIVRKIFDWFDEGVTKHRIAKNLEEAGVSCPTLYAIQKGYIQKNDGEVKKLRWNPEQVSKILKSQQYCGDMVQNKQMSTFLQTGIKGTCRHNKQEEWIVVLNTHPAIISREQFERVKRRLVENADIKAKQRGMHKQIVNPEYCLSGVLKCAHCGSSINVKRRVKNGIATYTYICPVHDGFGSVRCEKRDLNFEETNKLVFLLIKRHISNFLDTKQALIDFSNSNLARQRKEELHRFCQQKEAELRKVKIIKSRLYEDYCSGLFDTSDYADMSKHYAEEICKIEKLIDDAKVEIELYSTEKNADSPAEKKLHKFLNARKLTKAMVDAFVESIIVDNEGRFEVNMKLQDEYEMLLRKLALCEGGMRYAV